MSVVKRKIYGEKIENRGVRYGVEAGTDGMDAGREFLSLIADSSFAILPADPQLSGVSQAETSIIRLWPGSR